MCINKIRTEDCLLSLYVLGRGWCWMCLCKVSVNVSSVTHSVCESSWLSVCVYVSGVTIVSHPFCVLQTKSEAAEELEKFKKVVSEEEKSASAPFSTSPPPVASTSPSVSAPPPPAPMVAPPPPPPPVLPQGKPGTVAHSSANTPLDPALAREAMLEAIRSGSAADRLKKVQIQKNTAYVVGVVRETSCRSHHTMNTLKLYWNLVFFTFCTWCWFINSIISVREIGAIKEERRGEQKGRRQTWK